MSSKYQPFYCEENVWHLCQEPRFAGRRRHVVFISGAEQAFVMWHQRAAARAGGPILWDYHVILLAEDPWEVWDLDTTLGLPVAAATYLAKSFRPEAPPAWWPLFRVIDAEAFVRVFASDRSHMCGADGRFERPPPAWPLIGPPGAASNLLRFVDMSDPFAGEVLDLAALRARVANSAAP